MRPGRTCEKRQAWPGLRKARLKAGLSLLGASVGICAPPTLHSWEVGTTKPTRAAVKALAERYGVRMKDLS